MGKGDDDDVDIVIDAWAAALPDVDFAPLDIVSRLRRLLPQMQEVRSASFAANNLRTWEFEFLSVLRQHGGDGMTPSMLAARLHVTSGNLASQLDRLAARSPGAAATCTWLRGMVARFELDSLRKALAEDADTLASPS